MAIRRSNFNFKSFTPKSIPGCKLWLDAARLGLADGTSVTTWTDLSGNANDATQSTSAAKPTSTQNAINGKFAVRFDGTDDYMALPSPDTLGIGANTSYELFIVIRSTAYGSIGFLFAGSTLESHEVHIPVVANTTDGVRFIPNVHPGSTADTSVGVTNDSKSHIINCRLNGTTATGRVDGVDGTANTSSSNAADSGAVNIGRRSSGNLFHNGDIGELIIYNRALNTKERNKVERYLSQKWGIPVI